MSTSCGRDISVLTLTCRTAGGFRGSIRVRENCRAVLRRRKPVKRAFWGGLGKATEVDRPHCAARNAVQRRATDAVRTRSAAAATLFYAEQLDVADQRGVWRNDAAGAAGAIAELGRNDQRALAADLHGRDAFVPAANDLADGAF